MSKMSDISSKIVAITCRLYYLLAIIIAIILTVSGTIGVIKYNGDFDVLSWLILGILILPVAKLFHIALNWVIYGKTN